MLQAALTGRGLGGGALQLILQSGPVVQAVLLVLVLFSVISWAIIAERSRSYRRARRENARVTRALKQAGRPSDLRSIADMSAQAPCSSLLRAVAQEMRHASENPGHASPVEERDLDRALRQATIVEMTRLERRLGFLATTGSITPFIGLFGTVWGIMNAFHGIGAAGSASLATVAPGISEALIATAAGLAAAIPAVMAYNHFVISLRTFRSEMEGFSLELLRWCDRTARHGAVAAPGGR
jgi:biopolymer transport protein TolQ